ncbi:hypothetical protein FY528_13695 [Hymenobacter lutimineralis]|uniref:Outer membrane beta-barrel protein n=1 Tax=Hymenobacter lutimineralis TaxID=2606448 RepID=A0A5D6V0F8_9BACT|nr:hypothetical protein [Hymenobacter lutimineralis]TYZ08094.1 hypothetical protein FY528_13695 [Hymenobacter lutimineralis]
MRSIFLLALGLGLWSALPVAAQRVLLQGNVAADTAVQRTGPNRARYGHLYVGYAVALGSSSAAAPVSRAKSGELFLGWRQKWRFSQTAAVGLGTQYSRLAYRLTQQASKQVPTATLHSRESLVWQQLQAEPFVRLNFGARGNVIGRYLDLGGWGSWAFATLHTYKDKPGAAAKTVKVTEQGLPYTARWAYGASLRLGSGRYALVARRRFSEPWRGTAVAAWSDLPRWTVGLDFGWL